VPFRNIQILIAVVVVCLLCHVRAEQLRYGGKIGYNIQLIEEKYVDKVDPDELYIAAMQGIVSKLDEFSDFIPPSSYEEFQAVIEQHFGGVGILIEGPPQADRLTVVMPLPGSPAYEAGLRPGDVITKIDDKSTSGLNTDQASKLMRGPIGESVTLTVKRRGETPVEFKITRDDIAVDSVYGDRTRDDSLSEFMLEEDERIAYIRVSLFGEKTAREFAKAIETVNDKAEAVVIDLRFNPGGILDAAVAMCDMLIDEGIIVSTNGRTAQSKTQVEATNGTLLKRDIPIVVLVNDGSASASEIMAGCLQDSGRALIAGSRSYGKGTVQQVFSLDSDKTALKFTTARFYRPSGANIHRTPEMKPEDQWGIQPEEELALDLEQSAQIRINRRWWRRNDPRAINDPQAPPTPDYAGDPQLELAVLRLQQTLNADSSSASATGDVNAQGALRDE